MRKVMKCKKPSDVIRIDGRFREEIAELDEFFFAFKQDCSVQKAERIAYWLGTLFDNVIAKVDRFSRTQTKRSVRR